LSHPHPLLYSLPIDAGMHAPFLVVRGGSGAAVRSHVEGGLPLDAIPAVRKA